MALLQRLRNIDWIDVWLWVFRIVIIVGVVVGITRKLFFGAGTPYGADEWIDFFVSGLSQGGLYALIALGYTMVYGVLFMINFAHGEYFMSGAMASTYLVAAKLSSTGFINEQPILYLVLVTMASVLTSMAVSLLTERIAYRPLRRAPRLVPLITAIGASFFWQYIFRGLFGSAVKAFPVPTILEGRVNVFGLDFLKVRLIVIIVSIVALVGLYLFVQKTKTGKSIRAVAEDKDVAALMGIDVDRAIATTFAIGATMAGIAAVLWGLVFKQVIFSMGFVPGIKAFTAAVLGGIGSIPGAALGGFFLGVIEAVGPPLILEGLGAPGAHQLKDVTAFLLLVLVLIFRPQGIIGERLAEKKA
ncbi:leucine/isoleucine/valine transporter subunit; membrane component of ABC superfamily [Candidatus Promineifilum breve]|uniref:Leucine/isoleucine/valine transporter subunit membrane component of ABC superfamily n=1 Tax=Candidatus Promineifilum breve TaxID=1806508 RepID=A0A160T3Z2_9CHLR|nr:branched-chain amino acid ABC transporter permease [Candidatus Promineifilum breve]CUS03300.2 leucine/isoleucine/valine transporter subunit; membrane component of ABC superfamily [Candidatus Promineifilum breve]